MWLLLPLDAAHIIMCKDVIFQLFFSLFYFVIFRTLTLKLLCTYVPKSIQLHLITGNKAELMVKFRWVMPNKAILWANIKADCRGRPAHLTGCPGFLVVKSRRVAGDTRFRVWAQSYHGWTEDPGNPSTCSWHVNVLGLLLHGWKRLSQLPLVGLECVPSIRTRLGD